jgi:hypothetical protein
MGFPKHQRENPVATWLGRVCAYSARMRLLIDCYNVLHADKPVPLAGLHELSLCAALGRTGWALHGVVLIADGNPKPHAPAGEHVPGVELVYAGTGRSADDEIARRVARDTAPRRLVVVSDDREVQKHGRSRRCNVWSCDRFYRELLQRLRNKKQPGTQRPIIDTLPPEQVEAWLEEFGLR